jgi:hypothetical protein
MSSVFAASGSWVYQGIAVFANRRGYRFLSDYFRWLAERPISEIDGDPGDHDHLTPRSPLCDEMDFSFDTLTKTNRDVVLRNARVNSRSRMRGSPIRQFTRLFRELTGFLDGYLKGDAVLRRATIREIEKLIAVLEKKRAELKDL